MLIISFTATVKSVITKNCNYSLISNNEQRKSSRKCIIIELFRGSLPTPCIKLPLDILHISPPTSSIYMSWPCIYVRLKRHSSFLFVNDLVSAKQPELPGEQLLCILIRPSSNLSCAVAAFWKFSV